MYLCRGLPGVQQKPVWGGAEWGEVPGEEPPFGRQRAVVDLEQPRLRQLASVGDCVHQAKQRGSLLSRSPCHPDTPYTWVKYYRFLAVSDDGRIGFRVQGWG